MQPAASAVKNSFVGICVTPAKQAVAS